MAYIGKKPTDVPLSSADIGDESIDSDAYVDGSIDNAHIADDAIDSEHYADGSIDNAHIADDAIDSEHYAAGSIDEAHIADNAVSLAKMAGGTDGQIITFDASGDPVAVGPGSDGEVLTSTGAGSPPAFEAAAGGGPTLGTEVNTTSGTSVTIASGIPSGTKLIFITIELVADNATNNFHLQLGDSGGIETSGYYGYGVRYNNAPGITVGSSSGAGMWLGWAGASTVPKGIITLALKDSTNNTWCATWQGMYGTANGFLGGDLKSLSGVLTQILIKTESGSTFDTGSMNILYF